MSLSHDIILDEEAFAAASSDMKALKNRTEILKAKLEQMYEDLSAAMDTPSGKADEMTAKNVLIKPIDDMLLVIDHISSTLTEIIGTGHYKKVFVMFEELNASIKF